MIEELYHPPFPADLAGTGQLREIAGRIFPAEELRAVAPEFVPDDTVNFESVYHSFAALQSGAPLEAWPRLYFEDTVIPRNPENETVSIKEADIAYF